MGQMGRELKDGGGGGGGGGGRRGGRVDALTFDSGRPRVPGANCCWPLEGDRWIQSQ